MVFIEGVKKSIADNDLWFAIDSLLSKPLSLIPDILRYEEDILRGGYSSRRIFFEEDILWRDMRTGRRCNQRLLFISQLLVARMLCSVE